MTRPPLDATEAQFRLAMGRFASGVTVVTTVVDGAEHAMTASSVCSVSVEPLLFLVCIERDARFHDAVVGAGVLALNILSADQRAVSEWLATRGRPVHGQLERVPHVPGPATGAPLLAGVQASIEGRIDAVHAAGDHSIIVAEALAVVLDPRPPEPLLHYRSGYRALASLSALGPPPPRG